MTQKIIVNFDDTNATLGDAGGKGASLVKLARAGFPVPGGFILTTRAYSLFVEANGLMPHITKSLIGLEVSESEGINSASRSIYEQFEQGIIPDEIAEALLHAYRALPKSATAVAVRSSANAEDLPDASFAGQQSTYLNIDSEIALLNAVKQCWSSLWTARAINYRMQRGIAPQSVALAVVVQEMVPAEAAGILFTANPMDGNQDQLLINASWGLGEAVVSGLVSPDTITVEKSSEKVVSYQVAEKLIQTVSSKEGTREIPVSKEKQLMPVLTNSQVIDLVKVGKEIEDLYRMPMDIEWGLAGGRISILQARPITALPDLELILEDKWELPNGAYVAMRNNIVELMVDPLTPLFKTLGLSAVNRSMGNLLSGFFGNKEIMPAELIIAVNEYAFYNGSVKFGPMMKIILQSPRILRRMFHGPVAQWTEEGRPQYVRKVHRWAESDWKNMSSAELLNAVDQLAEAAIDAYGSLVSGVIPAAWITEALFTFVYKLLKSKDGPPAPTFLMGFDSLPIRAEKTLYDISEWVNQDESLADYIINIPTADLAGGLKQTQTPPGISERTWNDWQTRFQTYLNQFGHMIYNLDFGNPVPADQPAPVLEALKLFIKGKGTNPYQRQEISADRREQAVFTMTERLSGYRLKVFRTYLERAQRYAPLREDGLADVGLSYPLLREMLAELGRRFASAGMIDQMGDIYWLEYDELICAAENYDQNATLENLTGRVLQRKAIWKSAKNLVAPIMLPRLKLFGYDLMSLKSGRAKKNGLDSLNGVAASPGVVTARASVLNSPEDFSKMETGNVLVASMTTPAWTPLFARAAAVVTDIGGPLSHGSIVAREYGIPAVLGTDFATKYIKNGQEVTVDGNNGVVIMDGDI